MSENDELLKAAALVGILASAATTPAIPTDAVTQTYTWKGQPIPPFDDDYLFPTVPAGNVYFLKLARITNHILESSSEKRHSYLYTKTINPHTPDASTPNLDLICTAPIEPHTLGDQVSLGSADPDPGGIENFTAWILPLPFVTGMRAQYGGNVTDPDSAEMILDFDRGSPCVAGSFVKSAAVQESATWTSEPVPAGKKRLLCVAFGKSNGSYTAQIRRTSENYALVQATLGADLQFTGGYSTQQSSKALGGENTIWQRYIYVEEGDSISVDWTTHGGATCAIDVRWADIDV